MPSTEPLSGALKIAELIDDWSYRTAHDFRWDMHEPVTDGHTLYARYAFSYVSTFSEAQGRRVGFRRRFDHKAARRPDCRISRGRQCRARSRSAWFCAGARVQDPCARGQATARRSRNGTPSRLTRMAPLREAAASVVERCRGLTLPATAAMDSATVVSPIVRLPNLRRVITNSMRRHCARLCISKQARAIGMQASFREFSVSCHMVPKFLICQRSFDETGKNFLRQILGRVFHSEQPAMRA